MRAAASGIDRAVARMPASLLAVRTSGGATSAANGASSLFEIPARWRKVNSSAGSAFRGSSGGYGGTTAARAWLKMVSRSSSETSTPAATRGARSNGILQIIFAHHTTRVQQCESGTSELGAGYRVLL